MKKNLLLLILNISFFILNSFSQGVDWLWARQAGGSNNDYGNSVAADANGNVYVTGFFESASITFGSTTLNNAGPSGTPDMFLAKYDSLGNILWAKSGGGNYYDKSYSVAVDGNGNVFVTGYYYSSSATFGTIVLTNANSNYSNIFIVKYDAGGNVLWAKSAGGNDSDVGSSIATDMNGDILVTGYFVSASAAFGTITLNNPGYPYNEIFIAKYDAAGNVLWAKSAGGVFSDAGEDVATDANGNVFMTGNFTSASVTFGTTTLNGGGGSNMFAVKYDSSGTVRWAKTSTGMSGDYGSAAATDAGGNVYVTGHYDFFSVIFGGDTLFNAGQSDVFIIKYDSLGTVLWAKSAGGINNDFGTGVASDASGNVFMTGNYFSSSITFGSAVLMNDGNNEIFAVGYDSAGNMIWATKAGGIAIESGQGIAAGAADNVYVTGVFNSAAVTFDINTLNNAGGSDIFLARIDSTVLGVEENNFENGMSIFPNPATNQLLVISYQLSEINWIEIYDVLGKQQLTNSFDYVQGDRQSERSRRHSIDVSSLSPGIYFVKVKTEKGERTAKFVKQ